MNQICSFSLVNLVVSIDTIHTGFHVYGNTIIVSIDNIKGWVYVHAEHFDCFNRSYKS